MTEESPSGSAWSALAVAILENSADAILAVTLGGAILSWNRGAEQIFGYTAAEMIGRPGTELFPQSRANEDADLIARLLSGEPITHFESQRIRKDGAIIDVSVTLSPVRDETGRIVAVSKIIRDITERLRLLEQVATQRRLLERQRSNERFSTLFRFSPVPIVMTSIDEGRVLEVNDAFLRQLGIAREQVVGRTSVELRIYGDTAVRRALVERLLRDGHIRDHELVLPRSSGSALTLSLSSDLIETDEGTCILSTLVDVTERRQAEAHVHHLAHYDALTDLPNRRLLHDRIGQAQAASSRDDSHGAVLFLDLDNFKSLNDTKGHLAGDQLLIEAAQRIRSNVRTGDTVGRLGGDEFLVLLEGLSPVQADAAEQAAAVGEKLRRILAMSYEVGGSQFTCTASVGVALFRGQSAELETLLRHADVAMYRAKSAGRNALRFFDPTTQKVLDERAALTHYSVAQQ